MSTYALTYLVDASLVDELVGAGRIVPPSSAVREVLYTVSGIRNSKKTTCAVAELLSVEVVSGAVVVADSLAVLVESVAVVTVATVSVVVEETVTSVVVEEAVVSVVVVEAVVSTTVVEDKVEVDVVSMTTELVEADGSTATSSHAVSRKSEPHFSDALPLQPMLQSSNGTGPLVPCRAREHQHSPLHSVPAMVNPSFSQVDVHPALVMLAKPPMTSSVCGFVKARPP
jgi:hypothetical protein